MFDTCIFLNLTFHHTTLLTHSLTYLTSFLPFTFHTHSIQYMRHLHEKVHKLDERTAPPAPEDDAAKEAAAVAASIYGAPLMMMGNETLMLQNGSAYSKFTVLPSSALLCSSQLRSVESTSTCILQFMG